MTHQQSIVIEALDAAIAAWQSMVDGQRFFNRLMGYRHSSLCSLFLYQKCAGCPIRERTGKALCEDTPLKQAQTKVEQFGSLSSEFRDAAQEELDFLKSLKNGEVCNLLKENKMLRLEFVRLMSKLDALQGSADFLARTNAAWAQQHEKSIMDGGKNIEEHKA